MVGEAAQRHPEIVQQVAQAGHAIGIRRRENLLSKTFQDAFEFI